MDDIVEEYSRKSIGCEMVEVDALVNSQFSNEPFRRQWVENIKGEYVGSPKTAAFLKEKGIVPEVRNKGGRTCSIGFNASEQKWYGWSHRAIYGFGIGSTTKKGDCGYSASTVDELAEDYANFFADISEEVAAQKAESVTKDYENGCIHIGKEEITMPMVQTAKGLEVALDNPELVPEEAIEFGGYTIKVGRGEWTAETLDDARRMACDFAEGIS